MHILQNISFYAQWKKENRSGMTWGWEKKCKNLKEFKVCWYEWKVNCHAELTLLITQTGCWDESCHYSHFLSHYGLIKTHSIPQCQQHTVPCFFFPLSQFFQRALCKYSQRLTRSVYRNLTVLLLWTVWDMETRVMRRSELHSWAEGNYRFEFRKADRESGMLPFSLSRLAQTQIHTFISTTWVVKIVCIMKMKKESKSWKYFGWR